MGPHVIRLRGGWECLPLGNPEARAIRLTLPAPSATMPPGPLRLIRRFNRPLKDTNAAVVLRLEDCPGIQEVRFNGDRLEPVSPDQPGFELPLDALASRNEIVIEAMPSRSEAAWGSIALVFRDRPERLMIST